MRKLCQVSLSALIFTGMFSGQVIAQDILVYLTSGSGQTQGMALVLSGQMLQKKANVHILLCDDAGDLALADTSSDKLKPLDKSPEELLNNLIQQGATVEVCALYVPNKTTNVTLKAGIEVAKPPVIASMLLDEKVKTFSF